MIFKKSKKALSAVIVTLIVIALALVAIGIVWVVVNTVLEEGSGTISRLQFEIYSEMDLKITLAQLNNETTRLTAKVARSSGKGNLSGISFIVSNDLFANAVRRNTDLGELEQQTFYFYIYEFDFDVDSAKYLSIAPITLYEGEETTGEIMDTVPIEKVSFDDEIPLCYENSECGTDDWVSGTQYCAGNIILQQWVAYLCEAEGCTSQSTHVLKEDCSLENKTCYAAACIEIVDIPDCVEDSDCGTNSWVPGTNYCDEDDIFQIWRNYTC